MKMLLAVAVALAPTPAPTPAGPCSQGALATISDLTGIGRAPASNGAACVVPPHEVVIEAGYRNQVTTGPVTQILSAYPNPVVRVGLGSHNEV
ncbi:MAG TPA: hypothetical protein VFE17_06720, partial [Candidatus Baltobacteraceae bacterium]|nr:hypothetical protein [Candidatus Baltobacteraceae bacterium]